MARDPLAPFGRGSPERQPYEYQLPTFDPLVEAQGGYGPQTITRPIRGDVLAAMQRDVTLDPEFRTRADALAAQQFALATRGLPHHQVSLMRQSLLPQLMLGAMQNQDLQGRYQRERYGFDPFTRRFLNEYEEEREPGLGNMRRALDLLQQRSAQGRRQPALGEGLEIRQDLLGPGGS